MVNFVENNVFCLLFSINSSATKPKSPFLLHKDSILSVEFPEIQKKFESFGFEVIVIDGHNEKSINEAILQLWHGDDSKPKALIAKTIKGKGVSFMENNNLWHYSRLNKKSFQQALLEVSGKK